MPRTKGKAREDERAAWSGQVEGKEAGAGDEGKAGVGRPERSGGGGVKGGQEGGNR